MRIVAAICKLALFFMLCVLVVPLQMLVLLFHKGAGAYVIPQIWHKGVCAIFGLKITISGTPETGRQVLYVSNHLSYLDIPVIGTVLRASFVAKKDVARWPVFGFLSKLQQTAFIDRARGAAAKEANALDSMLERGKSLIVFPEGTSTDGREVLPFKSSLFSLALQGNEKSLAIQPFTIRALSINGKAPDTQALRDIYAWHRDMQTELPTHLWLFALSKGAHIHLTFHDIVLPADFGDRKTLANACFEAVSMDINTGHMMAA